MAKTCLYIAGLISMGLIAPSSCRSLNNRSDAKIHAGRLITANSQNKVGAVFKTLTIMTGSANGGSCTGTAVSTNTAITAAHCVYNAGDPVDIKSGRISNKKYCVSNALYNNLCSSDIYIDPAYIPLAKQAGAGHDVAWVVFPSQTFKSYFSMYEDAVKASDEALMVGYSTAFLSDHSMGSKRFGFNYVQNLVRNSTNDIATSFQNSFRSVGVDPGDSGGPLFVDCRIAGVASVQSRAIAADGTFIPTGSQHTNLTNPSISKILRAATGAYFCGLTGLDESFCPKTARFDKIADYDKDNQEFPCDIPNTPRPRNEKNPTDPHPTPDGGKTPQNNQPDEKPAPSPGEGTLDCNKDYSAIRKGGSGICLNRSSGLCYRYGSGDVQYQLGSVACPR